MPQNRKLHCSLGDFPAGEVVPTYALAGHDVAELDRRGLTEPTDAPVTVEVVPPKVEAPAAPDDVYADRNRLAGANKSLARDNEVLAGRVGELERLRDSLKAELGKYAEQALHLTTACETHQAAAEQAAARAAELESQLAEKAAECVRLGSRVAELEKQPATKPKK